MIFSTSEKQSIADAIASVEKYTSSEIVMVTAKASDTYQSYILLYGFTLASLIDLAWCGSKSYAPFPYLLAVQIAVMTLLTLIPGLRHLVIKAVPEKIKHRRASYRAFEEYQHAASHVAPNVSVVVFYVSLAERYAHIQPSRLLCSDITQSQWNAIITEFTSDNTSRNFTLKSMRAIERIGQLLAIACPLNGQVHTLGDQVIER